MELLIGEKVKSSPGSEHSNHHQALQSTVLHPWHWTVNTVSDKTNLSTVALDQWAVCELDKKNCHGNRAGVQPNDDTLEKAKKTPKQNMEIPQHPLLLNVSY